MGVLVDSCVDELDRVGVRERNKSCTLRAKEEGKYTASNIKREVTMKISIEDCKKYNIPSQEERLKTVRQKREVDETKSF